MLGEVGFEDSYEIDIPLGLCADVEGLFVDLPPRPRERFTLTGFLPDGPLADLLDRLPAEALGTERAWLGDIAITAPAPPPGTPPSWWGEDLGDVVVLAQRPNPVTPGTVDVDLDGFVQLYDRTDAVARPGDLTEFVLLGRDETAYGTCRDVTGVFREQATSPVPQVRLLGNVAGRMPPSALCLSAERSCAARRPMVDGRGTYSIPAPDGSRQPSPALGCGRFGACSCPSARNSRGLRRGPVHTQLFVGDGHDCAALMGGRRP